MIFDVLVIGAGFAGLRSARDLVAAGKSVLLIEGGDRVGGRAYTATSSLVPLTVEIGGAYIHRMHHPRVAAELDHYRIRTVPAADATVFRNKLGREGLDKALPIPIEEAPQAEAGLYRMLADAHRIDVEAGLENKGLEDLDIPLQDYVDSLGLGPATRQLVLAWGWNMMGQHPTESSALWALQFVAAHHHSVLGVVLSIDEVVPDGIGLLASAMAAGVPQVRLGTVVTAVRQDADDVVRVGTADGREFLGRRVIVATPLNTWRGITFDPPLPPERARVIAEGHGGRGIKILVRVGNVPAGVSCVGDGVFPTLYDYLDAGDGTRLLVAFTDTDSFQPSDSTVAAAVHHYLPEAEVLGYEYHDWGADPLFKGPWVSPRIGQFSRVHKALGDRHGSVYFVGSDVSLRFPGYIEGALETAERAVTDIVASTAEALAR
jgi:monoamine oxidase